MWFVYILECADGTLYTGTTNDLDRRVAQHNGSKTGAKYTKSRRPVKLVQCFGFADRSAAAKEEARIKKLSRREKRDLIEKS